MLSVLHLLHYIIDIKLLIEALLCVQMRFERLIHLVCRGAKFLQQLTERSEVTASRLDLVCICCLAQRRFGRADMVW